MEDSQTSKPCPQIFEIKTGLTFSDNLFSPVHLDNDDIIYPQNKYVSGNKIEDFTNIEQSSEEAMRKISLDDHQERNREYKVRHFFYCINCIEIFLIHPTLYV